MRLKSEGPERSHVFSAFLPEVPKRFRDILKANVGFAFGAFLFPLPSNLAPLGRLAFSGQATVGRQFVDHFRQGATQFRQQILAGLTGMIRKRL
jgi:hypothetical protein